MDTTMLLPAARPEGIFTQNTAFVADELHPLSHHE
jgi:hypothetical protein